MVFGVISLLMGHWIGILTKICIKASAGASRFFPCESEKYYRSVKSVLFHVSSRWNESVSRAEYMIFGDHSDCPKVSFPSLAWMCFAFSLFSSGYRKTRKLFSLFPFGYRKTWKMFSHFLVSFFGKRNITRQISEGMLDEDDNQRIGLDYKNILLKWNPSLLALTFFVFQHEENGKREFFPLLRVSKKARLRENQIRTKPFYFGVVFKTKSSSVNF